MKHEAPGAESAQEIHEALYDGADLVVTFKPNGGASVPASQPGGTGGASVPASQAVKVRKIPREEFTALSLVIGDDSEAGELREAALYTARDEAWAATLDDESLTRVLEEGHRLNFFTFARWFRRRGRTMELMSGNSGLLRQALEVMKTDPQLSRWLDSTNGSSARATGTPPSGNAARTN